LQPAIISANRSNTMAGFKKPGRLAEKLDRAGFMKQIPFHFYRFVSSASTLLQV